MALLVEEEDEVRLSADRISLASLRFTTGQVFWHSSSELELLHRLSAGVTSEEAFEMRWREERCGAVFGSNSRRGESSSDDDKIVEVVGAAESGDPSDSLDRKPAWNRHERGLRSIEGSGGAGTGGELAC
jgi:hypothetical protein